MNLIVDEQLDAVACSIPEARTNPNAVRVSQVLQHLFRNIWRLGSRSFL